MKKIAIIITSLVFGLTTLDASAFSKLVKYKSYKVNITSEKPITVGSNDLKFKITNSGKVVDFKEMSIKLFMPAMPGMPEMESITKSTKNGIGDFENKINPVMSGTWQMHMFFIPESGRKLRMKTSLNI